MLRSWAMLLVAAGVCCCTGCAGMSNTAKGAGLGGAIGAGTGAIIGDAAGGKAGKGAIIGALTGSILGGAIGNEEDQREKAEKEAQLRDAEHRAATATTGSPMGITDVVQLVRDGTPESVVINQIRSTGSTFQLSTEDVRMLQSNQVPANVIIEMQNRRPDNVPKARYLPPPPPRVHHVPAPPPEQVIIIREPVYVPPPPPPGFGIGVRIR